MAQNGEICSLVPEGNMAFFYVANEVGIYKLGSGGNSRTVTLFKEDGFENFIVTEGAVEIVSITENQVIGKIDARYDSKTFVNGNFTVSICPD